MIQKVKINNFQSHKNTALEFVAGVNVITGSSDSGKTAIIRALKWALTNRPGGDDFRSDWGGDTSVDITFTDGQTIHRSKGKRNLYSVNELELVAFGSDVPDEVLKCANMSEINMQFQLDSPFLLTKTAGEVAIHFNKIARIDQIDKGLRTINSWVAALQKDVNYLDTAIDNDTEALREYDYLPKFNEELEVLESNVEKQKQLEKQITILAQVITGLDAALDVLCDEDVITTKSNLIETALVLYNDVLLLEKDIRQLTTIRDSIKKYDSIINTSEDYEAVEVQLNEVAVIWKKFEEDQSQMKKLDILVAAIQNVEFRIENKIKALADMEDEFHAGFPDVCPLCDQLINK